MKNLFFHLRNRRKRHYLAIADTDILLVGDQHGKFIRYVRRKRMYKRFQ